MLIVKPLAVLTTRSLGPGVTVGVSLDMSISEEKDVEGCIHGECIRASWNDSFTFSELEYGQIQPKDPKLTAYSPHRWFVLGFSFLMKSPVT